MTDRPGLRKGAAIFFFAATWTALIVAVIGEVGTPQLILHAIAAGLGLVALVIAFRRPL